MMHQSFEDFESSQPTEEEKLEMVRQFKEKYFFPEEYHEMPDVGEMICQKVQVPVVKKPKNNVSEETAHYVYCVDWTCGEPPYTKDQFLEDLDKATTLFADKINECEVFETYPITYFPQSAFGIDYMDWTGHSYDVDIRFFVMIQDAGPQFYITTLVPEEL